MNVKNNQTWGTSIVTRKKVFFYFLWHRFYRTCVNSHHIWIFYFLTLNHISFLKIQKYFITVYLSFRHVLSKFWITLFFNVCYISFLIVKYALQDLEAYKYFVYVHYILSICKLVFGFFLWGKGLFFVIRITHRKTLKYMYTHFVLFFKLHPIYI